MANLYESLHNHTSASDGTQSHLELLSAGERWGYHVVAITDHDVLPTEAQLNDLAGYNGPTKWLVGCEVSSGLPKELDVRGSTSMHILGLFVNPHDSALVEHCAKAQAARSERVVKIVDNLKNLGFVITVDDVMSAAGGDSVGRPHIVRALKARETNAAIIESLRASMERAAVADPKVAMDYALMQERPASDYPYRLFLSEDAFVPGVYVDYLYSVDMDTAVNLIRRAGGAAVLAHWYTVSRQLDPAKLEELLQQRRLDGVELMGNPLNVQARKAEPLLAAMAKRTNALTTYGVDCHREEEMRGFANDGVLARKTIGQTDALIHRVAPDLTYSNLGK